MCTGTTVCSKRLKEQSESSKGHGSKMTSQQNSQTSVYGQCNCLGYTGMVVALGETGQDFI